MITKQFSYSFGEFEILPESVGGLMGFGAGTLPDPFPELISAELHAVSDFSDISGGFRLLDCVIPDKHSISTGELLFKIGRTVNKMLSNSTRVALFVCTAGQKISDRISAFAASGLITESYIADVIGTMIVEKAMDRIQDELKQEMEKQGLSITNRYSPGYCEWKITEQNKLFSLLPGNYCGITLTESSLMVPVKSVSGFIGIGEKVVFNDYVCDLCSSVHCMYRNRRPS